MNKQSFSKLTTKITSLVCGVAILVASVAVVPSQADAYVGESIKIYPTDWRIDGGNAKVVVDGGAKAMQLSATRSLPTAISSSKLKNFAERNRGKKVQTCVRAKNNGKKGFYKIEAIYMDAMFQYGAAHSSYYTYCAPVGVVDPDMIIDGNVYFWNAAMSSYTRVDYIRWVRFTIVP